ncbi:hypothetical protein CEXT_697241 [Caerostris extrusa]|uniref:Uncharacterized protein n=1 Tax=Caerostris extrusa TaxID=172846 RepID=A0AAV4RJC5_CAEEX|nr:hypothetical protein CEXT_697241 [Caerostris extrusa]
MPPPGFESEASGTKDERARKLTYRVQKEKYTRGTKITRQARKKENVPIELQNEYSVPTPETVETDLKSKQADDIYGTLPVMIRSPPSLGGWGWGGVVGESI